MPHHIKKSSLGKWLYIVAAIFFVLAISLSFSYYTFEKIYTNKIYPSVYLGNINLGGYTADQAKNLLNQKIDRLNQNGIQFFYNRHQVTLLPLIASVESDLVYQIINFEVENTINQIYSLGRGDNFYHNLRQKIKTLFYHPNFNLLYTVNEEEIEKTLQDNFSRFTAPAQDAKLNYVIDKYRPADITFNIEKEKFGKTINYKKGLGELKINLAKLNDAPIILSAKIDYPQIYEKDCLNIESKAKNILDQAPLTLKCEKDRWKIGQETLVSWLTLKLNPDQESLDDKIIVGLNSGLVEDFLLNKISSQINQEPIDAKFEVKDGRVVEFQASQDGLELNINASFTKIEYELVKNENNQIELVTKELKSIVHTEEINDLGIKEIIGIGKSDFSGSPRNRCHNIKVGANTLNGILIKPEEEFSLNNGLGKIDKSTGYLPELVIKDNKTIPEYGGGLCQIGTTMFRAALATGLPITMRRNHSYRVSYYEPAGTDATIYNPWPDFKFINDTPGHILIQSRIEGSNLYFDFWGTNDGRVVEQAKPTIYNIVRPGPTKLIETMDLPVGEKRCTEHAHNGADTYFDYKITYANKEVMEKRFRSHYVPWREVCLIGVEKLSEDKITATTTEEIKE